jgi:hypothetical protein
VELSRHYPIVRHPLRLVGRPHEIIFGLETGLSLSRAKVSVTQTSINGTGGVTTGLRSVQAGGAQTTVQNAETTLTSNALAAVTSIVNGTVNVVVIALATASNAISGVAKNVGCVVVGN